MRLLLISLAALAGLTACSSADLAYSGAADTASQAGDALSDDTGSDSGAAASDTADEDFTEPPYWFAISGTLTVVEGILAAGDLEMALYPESIEAEPICVAGRAAMDLTPQKTTPDETVYAWSLVSTDDAVGDCEVEFAIPQQLYLGLGALHADIAPAAAADGYEAGALYGLYGAIGDQAGCAFGGEDACVFGFAGTEQNLDAAEPAVDAPPLPAGEYTMRAVYAFTL